MCVRERRANRREAEREMRSEGKAEDNLSSQTGTKASQRETYQATRRETALFKCWHCVVCESVSVCAFRHTGHSWAHSSTLREVL